MSEIDQSAIINAVISVSGVLIAIIVTMAFWLRLTLIRLFNEIINGLKKDIEYGQKNMSERIDTLDKYGQKNRQVSYESRDKLAEHVEKYHTK